MPVQKSLETYWMHHVVIISPYKQMGHERLSKKKITQIAYVNTKLKWDSQSWQVDKS